MPEVFLSTSPPVPQLRATYDNEIPNPFRRQDTLAGRFDAAQP